MEEDASPSPAASGGGAGGGKLDAVFSATLSLVGAELDAVRVEATLEVEDPAGIPALLRVDVVLRDGGGRCSRVLPEGLFEACARRAEDLIRSNKLGSSEDSTICVVTDEARTKLVCA